jgi:hypothetical protein
VSSAAGRTLLVWLDPEQVPLVRAAVEAAGLDIVAAGSPRTGRSGEVAARLAEGTGGSVEAADDLRAALASGRWDAAFLAAPGSFGALADAQSGDREALRACRSRGAIVAALEPIPASALQLADGQWLEDGDAAADGGAEPVHLVPLARAAGPWLSATEVMADFGPVRTLVLEAWCRPHEGSLGARLLDAMDLALSVLGEPEGIDAAYVWPGTSAGGPSGGGGGGLRRLPGDSLRGLQGTLTANLRFADGRAACLALSDHGARWGRTITLLGPGGRLRIYDDGFEWIDPEGVRAHASRGIGAGRPGPERAQPESRSAAVLAEALGNMLGSAAGGHDRRRQAPLDLRRALAMAGAALLSARTGEGESPDTIRKMALIPA